MVDVQAMLCVWHAGGSSEHMPKQPADPAMQNGHAHTNGHAPDSSGQAMKGIQHLECYAVGRNAWDSAVLVFWVCS